MKHTCYYRATNPGGRIRFETLDQREAVDFAQRVYNTEGVIIEIHEVAR